MGIGPRRLIPQGIDVRPPVIKTFGLGKARIDVVAEICERNGWRFEHSFGEDRWLEYEELYRWLRDCDAIVLWYEEDLTSGGSAAAPLAISTRRPVFVNDTEWFRDLPDQDGDASEGPRTRRARGRAPGALRGSLCRAAQLGPCRRDARRGLHEGISRQGRKHIPEQASHLPSPFFAFLDSKPLIKMMAPIVPIAPLRRAAHGRDGVSIRLGGRRASEAAKQRLFQLGRERLGARRARV